jgi:hypothetical protein
MQGFSAKPQEFVRQFDRDEGGVDDVSTILMVSDIGSFQREKREYGELRGDFQAFNLQFR